MEVFGRRRSTRAFSPAQNLPLDLLYGALVCTVPLLAQLQVGDNLRLRLNGIVSAGYNGDYGNLSSSDHSFGIGAAGTASGYYYSPNFLSFNATPYYNQARDNSSYRSISNASGVDAQTAIFGGSLFPGSVNYSKSYDSQGNYAVPGLANYTTHGNSDAFGISWGSTSLACQASMQASRRAEARIRFTALG